MNQPKGEFESIFHWKEMKTQHSKICGMLLKHFLGKIYSTKHLHLKRNVSDFCFPFEKLEIEKQIKSNVGNRGNKYRVEISGEKQ